MKWWVLLAVILMAGCGSTVERETAGLVPTTRVITRAEFDAIRTGMSQAEVEGIIGGPGELLSESSIAGYVTRLYVWRGERVTGNANVTFQNGVVVGKAQFGL